MAIRPLATAGIAAVLLALPGCDGDDPAASAPSPSPTPDPWTVVTDSCRLAVPRIQAAVPGARRSTPADGVCTWSAGSVTLQVVVGAADGFRTESQDRTEHGATTTTYKKVPALGTDAYLRRTYADVSAQFRTSRHAVAVTGAHLADAKVISVAKAVKADLAQT